LYGRAAGGIVERPMKRALLRFALALAGALALLAAGLYAVYGGGEPYPDLSSAPLIPERALETVVSFPEPIGNVAVSSAGRLFFTVHPESRPAGAKLLEWVDGRAVPFPPLELQRELFQTPLGLVIDGLGQLWTIDHGLHGLKQPRLLAFDLRSGAMVREHRFTRAEAPRGSFLQDLRIDPADGTIYVADASVLGRRPAIVAYLPGEKAARRLLERHPSVTMQDWLIRSPPRSMRWLFGLVSLQVGVDGLTVSRDGRWLVYGAMSHDTLFRVPTAALRDRALSPAQLASRVEAAGRKPLSDGLATDESGAVLVTDVEHGAVLRLASDGRLETLVRSERVRWADGVCAGPGGWIYLADSALADQTLRTKAYMRAHAPYFIYRFRPAAPPRR
jgi:sugar lactone lactonase YvrE